MAAIPERAFDVPPEHIVQSSIDKDWNGLDVAEILHPLDDFALPAIPRHILVVNLSAPVRLREHLGGEQGYLGKGGVVILPADAPSKWHLDREGEVRHIHLYLPPHLIHRVASESDLNPDRVELIRALGVHDPFIEGVSLALLSELNADSLGSRVYAESLANLLIVHLLRRHSSVMLPSRTRRAGLAKTVLERTLDYIEDHLAADLSLAEMAALANLSPYYFARRFKESVGFSPHQYIIRRRIARARHLLATTNWTVTYIAHEVGFASESHLAMHFKRITGLSPKHYRQ